MATVGIRGSSGCFAFASAVLLVLLLNVNLVKSGLNIQNSGDGMMYLMRFGYLTPPDPRLGKITSEADMEKAIGDFQRMANMTITGKMDAETMKMMNKPRCGLPDMYKGDVIGPVATGIQAKIMSKRRRRKRYAIQGSMWGMPKITYYMVNEGSQHRATKYRQQVKEAFATWSEQIPINFQESSSSNADMIIRFAKGSHADGNPFDGPGGVLAHAFFPAYGGDTHFDDAETWTNDYSGTNFKHVAIHEFGHALGLSHSAVPDAIMAAFYPGSYNSVADLRLSSDDRMGIQAIYGQRPPPTRTTSPPKRTTTMKPIPQPTDICRDGKIDAITRIVERKIGNYYQTGLYVFKGDQIWKIGDKGIDSNYPQMISDMIPGLTGPIDAALYGSWRRKMETYIFKGDEYWRISTTLGKMKIDSGYPKPIRAGFPGFPEKGIDAAFAYGPNGNLYAIKGDAFYLQTPNKAQQALYPRDVKLWSRDFAKNQVTAAFLADNGRNYFFVGDKYYRWNSYWNAIDYVPSAPYPRDSGKWWFGCSRFGKLTDVMEEMDGMKQDDMAVRNDGKEDATAKMPVEQQKPSASTTQDQPASAAVSVKTFQHFSFIIISSLLVPLLRLH